MRVRRVLRGGSYNYGTRDLRTAVNGWCEPDNRRRYCGFGIVVRRRKR